MDEKRIINARMRFQVSVNGQILATGGVASLGALTAGMSWTKMHDDSTESLQAYLQGVEKEPQEFPWWPIPDVKIGDEVTIRILGPGECEDGIRVPY
jgi:hypothetical protein